MKKGNKLLIIVVVTLAITSAILIWKNCNPNTNQIHTLDSILVYIEQKGTDYAEDRLDYLIVNSYKKDELHRIWGTPTERILNADADMWILSEKQHLVVYYDKNEEVTKIDILTVTAFD